VLTGSQDRRLSHTTGAHNPSCSFCARLLLYRCQHTQAQSLQGTHNCTSTQQNDCHGATHVLGMRNKGRSHQVPSRQPAQHWWLFGRWCCKS
jgi:hypothetical protein